MLYQDESPCDIHPEISLLLVLSYLSHMINHAICSKVLSTILYSYIGPMKLLYVVGYRYPFLMFSSFDRII